MNKLDELKLKFTDIWKDVLVEDFQNGVFNYSEWSDIWKEFVCNYFSNDNDVEKFCDCRALDIDFSKF